MSLTEYPGRIPSDTMMSKRTNIGRTIPVQYKDDSRRVHRTGCRVMHFFAGKMNEYREN
jgi:hypothetical protein